MNAIIAVAVINFFALSYCLLFFKISETLVFSFILNLLFNITPLFFLKKNFTAYRTKISNKETSAALFITTLSLPIILLIIDRSLSGFDIDLNPVLMRDQMLERQRSGDGGKMLSILGNLLHIVAFAAIFKYIFDDKISRTKNITIFIYIALSSWLSGSRALILLSAIIFWGTANFKRPSGRSLILLGGVFLFFVSIFYLRAERSELDLDLYLIKISEHLRLPLNHLGTNLLETTGGIFILTFGYIFHSIPILSDILGGARTSGFANAPLVHFATLFFSYENKNYLYEGLFLTSAGNILHDFGYLGYIITLLAKCSILYLAARSRKLYPLYPLAFFVIIDSAMGVWTSVFNIIFSIPIFLGMLLFFTWKWIKCILR